MISAESVFKALEGRWSLTRRIVDSSQQLLASGVGHASFTKSNNNPNCLEYYESGEVTHRGQKPASFYKKYFFSLLNGELSVFFDCQLQDMYHTIDFASTTEVVGKHLCNLDHYMITYQFDLPRKYKTICEVSGPNKDFVIHSIYTRVMGSF